MALKPGARASLVSTQGSGSTAIEPLKVTPVDATGASDCFAGACLARLATGDDLPAAARAANVAAALKTQGYGAVAPLPRWSDVDSPP